MLMGYSRLCNKESLMIVFREPYGTLRMKTQIGHMQDKYLTYYAISLVSKC